MNPLTVLLDPAVLDAVQLDGLLAIAPLLDPVPAPGDVNPGWIAAALVVGLIVATVLLWFSMRKQLGKIRFEEEPDGSEEASSSGPDAADTENGSGAR